MEDAARWPLYVGSAVALKFLLHLALSASRGFEAHVAPRLWPRDLKEAYGGWAVVTGATDGIGRKYMEELAKRGFDVVLISRSMDKLKKVAKETEETYGVRTKVIEADFRYRSAFDHIKAELVGIDIGILVNNVGLNVEKGVMRMDELEEASVWDIVGVNTGSATILTRHVINDMCRRGRGLIVNMASAATYLPVPYQDIYSPTKVYVDWLTRGVNFEVRGSGVHLQSLIPFFVRTKMTSCNNIAHNFPVLSTDASTYARHAVNTLLYRPPASTAGYWVFDLAIWIFDRFPKTLVTMVVYWGVKLARRFGQPVDLKQH